jgi:glycerol uptake facilitator-like aquaporin
MTTTHADFRRRLVSEVLGTGFLLAIVIGSGIMGERLAGGNVAVALLANTVATGAGLVPLLLTFGPISGAHFNPAVTLADAAVGGRPWREVPGYILAQILGAFVGVAVAHIMFGEPVFCNPSSNGAWPPARRRARSAAPAVYTELLAAPGAGVGQCEGGRPPSPRSL